MLGHLTIYHCWPGRGPAAALQSPGDLGGRRSRHHRSDLRDGLLGQAEADPLLDSAPLGLLGDQDRPLVVVRHPDWSEQGAAGAVPWIRVHQYLENRKRLLVVQTWSWSCRPPRPPPAGWRGRSRRGPLARAAWSAACGYQSGSRSGSHT